MVRIYNAALLGLIDTNKSLSGEYIDDIFPLFDEQNEPVSLFELLQSASGKLERDDLTYRFSEDDGMRLLISASQVHGAYVTGRNPRTRGFIVTARDITKAKSLEEERDEFISVVSHELRTPVAITEGTISNLQYFLEKGASHDRLIPAIHSAHDQILLLGNMINDLGTLSRAERGVGDTAELIDVKTLANDLYKKYQPEAAKKGLLFNLDADGKLGFVKTSRLYLEEMLQNFITNAIKYTDKGSVTLGVRVKNKAVEFIVSDTGIGISKTDLKHVFEKFYRSEDYRTRETSGTGLGLYVVQKLARKLATKITATSRLNHGSSFSFSLPTASDKDST